MKRRVLITSMLLLLASGACTKRPSAPGTWAAGNQTAKLADYKGKVVVLDFYATWCEPCRAEIPRLVQMQKDYGAGGLQVIGLNVGGALSPRLEHTGGDVSSEHAGYEQGWGMTQLAALKRLVEQPS